ncbi:MAG: molybdopterin molybdotransferase MoeA [Candidatus Bathyarchaeota archaeon]|nr:molybdopterin molybdotransferase MoeA [Candidatus Bathyarchaeota archaeon]
MSKLRGFQKLTFTYEALQKWFDALELKPCREVTIPLTEAYNRVLAKDMVASEDLPRFDRSAVDGYAVRAEDTAGASQFKPLLFRLAQGDELDDPNHRQAKQVWTGNPLPKGANAVVMIEYTQPKGEKIEVAAQAANYANVSRKGEDLKKGEVAVEAGTRLKAYHLGLLAALGNTEVSVVERPKIAILATGNELAKTSDKRGDKQVYETNRIILTGMCRDLDAEPLDLGIAPDNTDDIVRNLHLALKIADAVITTGGTSVGGLDLVPEAVNKTGEPGIIVHGIAMRPAMPTALAVLEGKPVMVFSGNPVAAITAFEVFARPLICKLLGLKRTEERPVIKAVMKRKVATALGRKNFVRVKVTQKNEEFYAETISARGSGAISTMTRANGYVIVPENREGIAEGASVVVHMFAQAEVAS